jgi:hypothetical protein
MAMLPVQIPAVVDKQGLQGCEGVTGLLTPVHSSMFLALCDKQIIAFFDMGATERQSHA